MTSPKLPPSSHLIYVVMQKRGDELPSSEEKLEGP